MSEAYAPTGPIQSFVTPPSRGCALTLNDASLGEYESSASAIKTASEIHKKPTNSLSRLFWVGVRKRTKILLSFWGRLSVAAGAGAIAIPPGGTPKPSLNIAKPRSRAKTLCASVAKGHQRRRPVAQASTAAPTMMRYRANGENPCFLTHARNQATEAYATM